MRIFEAALICFVLLPAYAAAQDQPQAAPTPEAQQQAEIDAVKAEENKAIQRAAAIINQPVIHYLRSPYVPVQIFSPGWFHEGAIRPDFDRVDIRKTQETPYAKFEYVSSDVNPQEMFKGADLEFNRMTKFFYIDRTVPKKKLTPEEMQEINNLYRVIGKDEHELDALRGGVAGPAGKKHIISTLLKIILILIVVGVSVIFSAKKNNPGPVDKV